MRRNVGIYILTVAALLPVGWLIATSTGHLTTTRLLMVGGAIVTVALLLRSAWAAHHKGKLLPNACLTCDNPMRRVRPGELKPPPGANLEDVQWRCDRCGRLEGKKVTKSPAPPR